MKLRGGELITGLDVGSTKVTVVVGEVKNGMVEVIGTGSSPSGGVKKGVVVNIEKTVESIKNAIRHAEVNSGVSIKGVYAGISGRHMSNIPSNGIIAVKEKEINQKEIDRVLDAARAIPTPFDREILHVIPSGYAVNGENGISDPLGMEGVRLEANVQIIVGAATSVHNLVKSCQKSGLEVIETVFIPVAIADAILSRDEKNLGVAIVDIGGGTTDIAIFSSGSVCHAAVLPVGGNNFTNDIAIGLRTLACESEKIKIRYGCSMMSLVHEDEEIEVGYGGERLRRKIPRRYLIEIIQPRAEELFELIRDEIESSGYSGLLTSGIVLTGGSVVMEGMDVMAENILNMPVRTGSPVGIRGVSEVGKPEFAAGMGLVLYGAQGILEEERERNDGALNGVISRVKEWATTAFHM
jgi:cell division protein FtsA